MMTPNETQLMQISREIELQALSLRASIEIALAAYPEAFLPATQEKLMRLANQAHQVSGYMHDVPTNLITARLAQEAAERTAQQE